MRIQLFMRELGPFMTGVWVGKGVKEQIEGKEEGRGAAGH